MASEWSVHLFINERSKRRLTHTQAGLTQTSDRHWLHSVVCVGPFSILRLNTVRYGSPFNASNVVPITPRGAGGVAVQAAVEPAAARNKNVDKLIAGNVFDLTDGHRPRRVVRQDGGWMSCSGATVAWHPPVGGVGLR